MKLSNAFFTCHKLVIASEVRLQILSNFLLPIDIQQLLDHSFVFFWVNHDHLPPLLDILCHLAAQLHLTVLDSAKEAVHQLQVLDPVLLQEEVEPLVEDAGEMLVLYRVDHLPLAALALVQVLQSLLGFSVAACCQYPQQGIQQTPVQIGESQSHGRWKMILLITLQCSNLFLY